MLPRVGLTLHSDITLRPFIEVLSHLGLQSSVIDQPSSMDGIRGLVLTGGDDVNPALYGCAPSAQTGAPNLARDRLELALISHAVGGGVPILGVCRGLQILNTWHGGTLFQHLPNADSHCRIPPPGAPERAQSIHTVRIERGSTLHRALAVDSLSVNSRHHQAIDKVGKQLRAVAWSELDKVIEAIERPDAEFCVGVQWHPEDQWKTDATQAGLFRAFRDAVYRMG